MHREARQLAQESQPVHCGASITIQINIGKDAACTYLLYKFTDNIHWYIISCIKYLQTIYSYRNRKMEQKI